MERKNILPTFLKKRKMLSKTVTANTWQLLYTRAKQWAYLVSFHAFTLLRFKSNTADSAVGSDFWEMNPTFNANTQRLLKSLCTIILNNWYSLTVYAAERWTANFTGGSPTLTHAYASPYSRSQAGYLPTCIQNVQKIRKAVRLYFVCLKLYSHLHFNICFRFNQCQT